MSEIKKKLNIPYPIIVEGKYDRLRVLCVCNATVLTTDGFGIFKKNEKLALFRTLGEKSPVIVLTDSDGAGRVIRSHIRGILPPDSVIDLYTPDIKGKEKRKTAPSAAGLLGVEGMEAELLRDLFRPFSDSCDITPKGNITKLDFYGDGLSGRADAAEKRYRLCRTLGLPREMSANALLSAVNMLYTREEYLSALKKAEEDE